MPENESLNALLKKGDPAGEHHSTRVEERYARLLPRLVESTPVAVPKPGRSRLLWVGAPAAGFMAIVMALLWRPAAPPTPIPLASPTAVALVREPSSTPQPVPTAKPALPIKKAVVADTREQPRRRDSVRRHRKRARLTLARHYPRKHTPRLPKVQPVEPANVERIVIESTQPAIPVAIAIVGEGEKLSVIQTFVEEKS